jgi:hypothetical protein
MHVGEAMGSSSGTQRLIGPPSRKGGRSPVFGLGRLGICKWVVSISPKSIDEVTISGSTFRLSIKRFTLACPALPWDPVHHKQRRGMLP